ncbi:MAG: HAD family hydrolase [Roseofilum sp. SBFL]|uniref:HAD family hydrolase n=2 Tax=Roseofilum TaxID=1233426 RepID=UPI001B2E3384|nr:HAD family hydrolase [Roseofilum sp. SID3]MBP0043903.1 HAD family hydrolase [Roseofilum sp. SBFL]
MISYYYTFLNKHRYLDFNMLKFQHNIQHIWWDFGETLYKTLPTFYEKKTKRFIELYASIIGQTVTPQIEQECLQAYEEHGSRCMVFMSLGKDKDFWLRNRNISVKDYIVPDESIKQTFYKLTQRFPPHSLFSGKKRNDTKEMLRYIGIDINIFAHIITNDELHYPKPNSEGFNKILQLSNISAQEILYIGDRIKADLMPAKKAGMRTALMSLNKKNEPNEEEINYVDYIIKHPAEILDATIAVATRKHRDSDPQTEGF